MTVTLFGAIVFQWPIGALADRFDRTIVLALLGTFIALTGLSLLIAAKTSLVWLLVRIGLFGGLTFTFYPVSVARTHDLFEVKDIVAVSSALLLSYGIGATFGPIAASGFMSLCHSP